MDVEEAMRTRNGMFDSLIYVFIKETGLPASEIMLVEQRKDDGLTYFYARKKDSISNDWNPNCETCDPEHPNCDKCLGS